MSEAQRRISSTPEDLPVLSPEDQKVVDEYQKFLEEKNRNRRRNGEWGTSVPTRARVRGGVVVRAAAS